MHFVIKLLLDNNTYLPDPRKSAHGSQSYWPGTKSITFIIQLKIVYMILQILVNICQICVNFKTMQKPNHSYCHTNKFSNSWIAWINLLNITVIIISVSLSLSLWLSSSSSLLYCYHHLYRSHYNYQLLDNAEYHLKSYGDRGGSYPLRPIRQRMITPSSISIILQMILRLIQ